MITSYNCVFCRHMMPDRNNVHYPDVKAVALDDDNQKLTCVYNDNSLYIWDVRNIKKIGKAKSFLFHSGCIWGLEVCVICQYTILLYSSPRLIRQPYLPRNCGHIREVAVGEREN